MKIEKGTTVELMDMLVTSLREMNSMEISNRNLPNAINRTKANAMGVKSAISLAIYDAKNNANESGSKALKSASDEKNKGRVKLTR